MSEWGSGPVIQGVGPAQPWYQRRGVVFGALAAVAAVILVLVSLLGGSEGDGGEAAPEESIPITSPTVTTIAPPSTTTPSPTTLPDATTTTTTTTTAPTVSTTTLAPTEVSVWDLLQTRSDLTRVAELLVIAELDDVLRGADPFTFFAPTDEALAAFEATPQGRAILDDQGRLTTFLLRHLAFPRALTVTQIYTEGFVLVATGEFLEADAATGTLDGVAFLLVDDAAGNGVLHVIDDVLIP